jgi:hypothetical protein
VFGEGQGVLAGSSDGGGFRHRSAGPRAPGRH